MPTPVPPDPADRSSVHRATDRTHIRPPAPDDAPTQSSSPVPVSEPPTVITGQRAHARSVDPALAAGLAGRKLGPFELIEGVGAGGMAAVLRARDADLGRVVALKILPPDMAADPENVVRFKQEARSAALLDHDNVARVYHCGEDQGLHFIAFEFVEGDNLRQMMEAHGGIIPVPDAVSIMLQLAAGLAHAAERGVVHRDIKPSNIIVTPDGRAKIVDMGLARSLDAGHNGHLTQSGVTLGTFDYISPEQAIDPRTADVRSDIYSLGCTFYHALSGHAAVPDGTAAAKLDAQKNLLPPDPRTFNPAVPPDLSVILGRMMAKEPDRRYQHPDHLAAHLRGLARKLGLPASLVPLAGPAEDPVPPPPRLSAAWVATAGGVLALSIVIFTNAFRAPPPLPDWADGPGVTFLPEPTDPGPPPPGRVLPNTPHQAATVGELVALLRAGAKQIRLTGPEYDLWKYWDDPGHPVDLSLAGDDVSLEGDAGAVVTMGFAPAGEARAKTLTLRGTGAGTAVVRGIRFNLVGPGGEADAGLVVSGFARVHVEDCTFAPYAPPTGPGPAALALPLKGAEADLRNCYFAPGAVGVAAAGPGRLTAEDCAIAPHQAGIRVSRPAGATGDTAVALTHCTALIRTGAVVEVADGVPCQVRAGHCLFAGPTRYGPQAEPAPVVFRQKDVRASGSRYDRAGTDPKANAYHNLLAFTDGDRAYSFAECADGGLPVRDTDRSLPHPWESRDPFALLADPKKAFAPDRHLPELRVPGDGSMFGTRFLGPVPLYPVPLSPPGKEGRDTTVKVWDPAATMDTAGPGVYPTFKLALAAVQKGDTLVIRHNGELKVDPFAFDEDVDLTIKRDANYKPVLVPKGGVLKRDLGLFKLYGGRLVIDGLQFKMPAERPPAIAVLPGGGQFELRNSVVTFEGGENLAAVVLADPKNEMMTGGAPREWPVPRVTVENTLLRGKGRLLAVKVSRPFELDVKNVLAVLDGTLIDVEAAPADPGAGVGNVRLTRVTTCLGEGLLHLQAADRKADAPSAGLTKTEVVATQCLFLPAREAAEAFVRTTRLDTEDQVKRYFGWQGRGNVYGYDKKKVMLDLRPAEVPTMPAKAIEGDRWLGEFATEEAGDPFAVVRFLIQLPAAGQPGKFTGARPKDFRPLAFDPPRDDAPDCGAGELPPPFVVE